MQKFFSITKNNHKKTIFKNARIVNPEDGFDAVGDVHVENGVIINFGVDIFTNYPDDAEIIDCGGHILCPGLLDIQVHFRTPGQTHKEDIITGTKSAAAGGVTTTVCMANTTPTIDNVETLKQLNYAVAEESYARVFSYASITKGLAGNELIDMESLKEAGAIGFSDDGKPVMNSLIMRRAMEKAAELGILISQHAEDCNLSDGGCINEGKISKQLGVKGVPNASEAIIVARDLYLLELTGGHYHVLHISTHQAIEAVRNAKAKGLNVTCEAAPHHFMMTEDAVLEFDTMAKMNPPLRHEKDRMAIIEGLIDGTIDVIATDHAPHEPDSKCVHISNAAFGIVGLETMLPLSLDLYHKGLMNLHDVLGKMTYKAADVIGKNELGRIKIGATADFTLIDINREWEIKPEEFSSKSKNAPFSSYKTKGRAIKSIVGGQVVYEL
jgi:dihydroorotase